MIHVVASRRHHATLVIHDPAVGSIFLSFVDSNNMPIPRLGATIPVSLPSVQSASATVPSVVLNLIGAGR